MVTVKSSAKPFSTLPLLPPRPRASSESTWLTSQDLCSTRNRSPPHTTQRTRPRSNARVHKLGRNDEAPGHYRCLYLISTRKLLPPSLNYGHPFPAHRHAPYAAFRLLSRRPKLWTKYHPRPFAPGHRLKFAGPNKRSSLSVSAT